MIPTRQQRLALPLSEINSQKESSFAPELIAQDASHGFIHSKDPDRGSSSRGETFYLESRGISCCHPHAKMSVPVVHSRIE